MGSVIVALVLLAVLLAIGVAFAWQDTRDVPEEAVIYGVEDAIEFVYPRLTAETQGVLKRKDVRRILEWEVKYLQNPAVREEGGEPTVVAGINAARYVQERSLEEGAGYDGPAILDVLERQAEYLAALGAVGDRVTGDERDSVLRRSGETDV